MLKNIIRNLITRGLVALINFLVLIFSARYLGVSTRGEISIFLLNIVVFQAINEIFTGYSIVHYLPRFDFRKLVAAGIIYTLVCCLLLNIIFVFSRLTLPGYELAGFVVSLLVILHTFNCVLLLGKQQVKLFSLLSFMQPALLLAGIFFFNFSLHVFTFKSYLYPLFFSFTVSWVVSSFFVLKLYRQSVRSNVFSLKSLLVNGLYFQLSALMFVFANRFTYYLLPDVAQVGIYSAASALMESVLLFAAGIAPVLISKAANHQNRLEAASLTLSLAKVSTLVTVFFALLVFCIPGSFFVLVLGQPFYDVRSLMLLYAPGIVLVSFFSLMAAYLAATGQQRLVALCYLPGFLHTALVGPLLVNYAGVEGAAITAGISYLLMFIVLTSVFLHVTKLPFRRLLSVTPDIANIRALF